MGYLEVLLERGEDRALMVESLCEGIDLIFEIAILLEGKGDIELKELEMGAVALLLFLFLLHFLEDHFGEFLFRGGHDLGVIKK